MLRAVVTGSAGFIGSHFTRRLIADGWRVVQIDPAYPLGFGTDCRRWFDDPSSLEPCDLAVHCAAVVGGRATIDGDPLAVAVNFELDAAFARWCLRSRPAHVVYFSSSAAYPTALQTGGCQAALLEWRIDLDRIHQPDAVYGLAKIVGETLMRHLERAGVRTHVFRPFSGYGSDQALDYPFPSFIDRARRREDPFAIWGDGEQVRDWIHVDDIVGAVLAAVDQDVRGPLNLGSGVPVTFNQLADMVCGAAGYRPGWHYLGAAPQGVRYRVCDPTRMLEVYTPRISLEEGIARALSRLKVA